MDVPMDQEYEKFIAALRRSNAETEKFIEESRKLAAEREKFTAEQGKLIAESLKLKRDPWISGLSAAAAIGAVVAGLIVHFAK
jgi:hypothetical protein